MFPAFEALLPYLLETLAFMGFDAALSGGRKSIGMYRALRRSGVSPRLGTSLGRGLRLGAKTFRSPTTIGVAAGFAGLNALLSHLGGGEGGPPDSHVVPRSSQLPGSLPSLPGLRVSPGLGGVDPTFNLIQKFQQGGLL